ncbi:hypothetical protein M9458_054307 [Cirrhinus mrigala]|uniref:Uncharacterized protein n=1 Tax=Cirrhinus mrigala TaxID=683832 RepID=A0ABD0MLG3_CIRMR
MLIMVQAQEEEVVVDKGDEDALLVALAQTELADVGAAHKKAQAVQQLIDKVSACGLVQAALGLADAVAVPVDGQAEQLWGAMS